MRFLEVILISVMLCLFSSLFAESLSQIRKMDSVIEEYYLKTASLDFISQSFCNVCSGKGFKDFYDWEKVCAAMWNLETIEWESVDHDLCKGSWTGPWGSGEVFCRFHRSFE